MQRAGQMHEYILCLNVQLQDVLLCYASVLLGFALTRDSIGLFLTLSRISPCALWTLGSAARSSATGCSLRARQLTQTGLLVKQEGG